MKEDHVDIIFMKFAFISYIYVLLLNEIFHSEILAQFVSSQVNMKQIGFDVMYDKKLMTKCFDVFIVQSCVDLGLGMGLSFPFKDVKVAIYQ